MNIQDLSVTQFRRAAVIKAQVDRLNKQLSAIIGTPASVRAAPKKSGGMTASVRRKIAAAQRARWAGLRRAKTATRSAEAASKSKKKTMSPAARKKLSAKLKAYWATKKSGKK